MIITLSLLLIFGIDIVINYKELAEVFDNFMTIFFSNIYFPSVYVYVGLLLVCLIRCLIKYIRLLMVLLLL